MGTRSRLFASLSANALGYGTTVIIQLVAVPVLLISWGSSLYGEWLIVNTVPGYLAMSDLGLGAALGYDMIIAVGRNDRVRARQAFQSIHTVLWLIGICILIPSYFLLTHYSPAQALGIHLITGSDLAALIALLLIQVWLGQQLGVAQAGFRCEGHYALSGVLQNLVRLAEFAALVVAAFSGSDPIHATAAMVAVRLILTVATFVILIIRVPWLRVGVSNVRVSVAISLVKPGTGFILMAVSNALNLQTPIIAIGVLLGSDAVTMFSTARTLSRAFQQLILALGYGVLPELSRAFGAGDKILLKKLYRLLIAAELWVAIGAAAALAIFGAFLYGKWTHHLVIFDPLLFDLLLICLVAWVIWGAASASLVMQNRSFSLGVSNLAANVVAAPLYWLLGLAFGLRGVAFALILCEVLIVVMIVPAAFRAAAESPLDVLKTIISPLRGRFERG
jgi:O-antigen/teichoic acid export membrane protein